MPRNGGRDSEPFELSDSFGQKDRPRKKIPETDAIFANVKQRRKAAVGDDQCLRISIDSKAKVKIGHFSRGGRSRGQQSVTAADHDMGYDALLVPFGILEIGCGEQAIDQLWIGFGQSRETSDFIADSLELWWEQRKTVHSNIKRIQINLDNGPEVSSSRTQFMNRLVQFADRTGLDIELVYYPPYHSKYNPIERCWGILESHWNGAILSSVQVALKWASTMKWRGSAPIVELIEGAYERGVTITRSAYRPILARLDKATNLGKWSVNIRPKTVGY